MHPGATPKADRTFPEVYTIVRTLCVRGWINLADTSKILGYTTPVTMYQRQGTKNRIPTIKVGGQHRVSYATIQQILPTMQNKAHASLMVALLSQTTVNISREQPESYVAQHLNQPAPLTEATEVYYE